MVQRYQFEGDLQRVAKEWAEVDVLCQHDAPHSEAAVAQNEWLREYICKDIRTSLVP